FFWPQEDCLNPSISADGRYVVFETTADNLGFGALSTTQVVVSDLSTPTPPLRLVSHVAGLTGSPANSNAVFPSISSDGTRIAFESSATNLEFPLGNGINQIWVVDFNLGVVGDPQLVSLNPGGVRGDANSSSPHLSANGRFVPFQTLPPKW